MTPALGLFRPMHADQRLWLEQDQENDAGCQTDINPAARACALNIMAFAMIAIPYISAQTMRDCVSSFIAWFSLSFWES